MGKRHVVLSATLALLGSAAFGTAPAFAGADAQACTVLSNLEPQIKAAVASASALTKQEKEIRENTADPEEKLRSREDELTKTIGLQDSGADLIRGAADSVESPQAQGVLNNWADALGGFSAALQERLDSGLDESPDPKDASWLHAAAERVLLAKDAFLATEQSVCATSTTS